MSASIESKAIKSSVRNAKHDNELAEAEAILNELPPPQRLLACTRKNGAPHVYLLCPSTNLDSFCIKGISEMLCASGMVG